LVTFTSDGGSTRTGFILQYQAFIGIPTTGTVTSGQVTSGPVTSGSVTSGSITTGLTPACQDRTLYGVSVSFHLLFI
jgi:hypothetical protein